MTCEPSCLARCRLQFDDDDALGDRVHQIGNAVTFEDIEPEGRPQRGDWLSAARPSAREGTSSHDLDNRTQFLCNGFLDRGTTSMQLSLDGLRDVQRVLLHGRSYPEHVPCRID